MIAIETFDVAVERPITLRAACGLAEVCRDGSPVSFTTLWRWAVHGSDGVKLQAIRRPGGLCTSRESIARFFTRLSGDRSPPATRERAESHRRAERSLEADGI